ncbi:MAG TPA: hypothetical protein VK106_01335, partial [Balneolaceae bacterium]|nr:hypothetical protein [Balneolaceae bacterium]
MNNLKLTLILPLLLFFAACGGEKQNTQTQTDNSQQQAERSTDNDIRTIHIYGINQMKYVVKEN